MCPGITQAVLSERGVSSAGIAEKAELAKLAAESWSLPVLEVEAPKVEEAAAQAQEVGGVCARKLSLSSPPSHALRRTSHPRARRTSRRC